MSQPVQPPNQPQQPYGAPPADGNPYAGGPAPAAPTGNPYGQQPPAPYGQQAPAPTGNPFANQQGQQGQPGPQGQPGQQPGPFGGGTPFASAPPARNNILLGVLTALGAAIVAGILYGVISGSIEREFGYAAVGVGFLVGFAAAKVGGANPAVIGAAALFAVGAVYLGQLIGISMVLSDRAHVPFSEVVLDHFEAVTTAWKAESGFMTYVFFAFGAIAAVGGAKKAS
ncbi:hypothetical protein [Streptomyces sp. NPDC059452]|uniref:hypothetical protein n=1 Tax=Streptomyces sp. NPDC059452 TaxID=3346835 RepID=UPI0036806D60